MYDRFMCFVFVAGSAWIVKVVFFLEKTGKKHVFFVKLPNNSMDTPFQRVFLTPTCFLCVAMSYCVFLAYLWYLLASWRWLFQKMWLIFPNFHKPRAVGMRNVSEKCWSQDCGHSACLSLFNGLTCIQHSNCVVCFAFWLRAFVHHNDKIDPLQSGVKSDANWN